MYSKDERLKETMLAMYQRLLTGEGFSRPLFAEARGYVVAMMTAGLLTDEEYRDKLKDISFEQLKALL